MLTLFLRNFMVMEAVQPIMPEEKPKRSLVKRLLKVLLWFVISLILLLVTAVSLVFIYEDEVKSVIIKELNKNLNAEVKIDPKNIQLTILRTFPDCALEFKDIACMEAIQSKKRDTLLFAGSLMLNFDVEDLWNKRYNIKEIGLSDGFCRLRVNSKGKPNYIVWKQSNEETKGADSLSFNLELIRFRNMDVSYSNALEKFKAQGMLTSVDFSGKFNEQKYELKSNGELKIARIKSGQIEYLRNKSVTYNTAILVENTNYIVNTCEIQLNKMILDAKGNFIYGDSLSGMDVEFNGRNLDIQSVLSLLPESYRSKIHDYSSTGNFYASGNLHYSGALDVSIGFGIKNTTVVYEPKSAKLNDLNLEGKFISSKQRTVLELKNIRGTLLNDQFNGSMLLSDFNDPFLKINAAGTMDLSNLSQFWPIDTLSKLKGKISFQTAIESKVEELKKNALSENSKLDLEATVKDLVFQFKGQKDSTSILNCGIKAANREVEVHNLMIRKGRSDLDIDGQIKGAFNYLMDNSNPLTINGSLKSNTIQVEDFLFDGNSSAAQKSEVSIPDNIHFVLDASIQSLSFGKFSASSINGNIELKNRKLMAESVTLKTMDGQAEIDALMDLSGKDVNVSMHGDLKQINIAKLFTQMNNFDQETLKDNNIGGALTATIDFSGDWNRFLEPDLNSMKAIADLKIEQGKLVDFKPLESLSDFVDINDLRNIRFNDLQSHIEIAKSVISIPKTAIKNSALNIDFWGKHTFNNEIDYHIQLLISELLAKKRKSSDEEFGPVENDPENRRSAFVLMTGTVDKPIIKYDRKGLKQKIKEDIKQEKQNLKQILKDEFGLFKKDSIKTKEVKKADQTFKLEKPLDKKKEEKEEDDDF